MGQYFSFQRMITTPFVRVLYFVGFVFLTAGAIALIVWSGLQLYNATIVRSLGWRYVVVGAIALLLGNLLWRVLCELWIVLFNIHDRLAPVLNTLNIETGEATAVLEPQEVSEVRHEMRRTRSVTAEPAQRSAGVLGLS